MMRYLARIRFDHHRRVGNPDFRRTTGARTATRPGWRAQSNRERSERADSYCSNRHESRDRSTQPNERARVLMQPAGRQWDHFHEITLRWLGAIVILGMIVALGAAYLIMGRLRISKGRSGHKVPRFNAFERFSHWLTAVSFVVLGLTGLNITFGKLMLLPMIGPEAFSSLSQAAKYVHNFVSAAFVIGLVLIVALWIKDNIPRKVDVDWIKQGGGFVKSKHAPSGRFNAGEKLVFWFALGAGVAVTVSGYLLIFPFYVADIAGMQIAQIVHAVVAVLFVGTSPTSTSARSVWREPSKRWRPARSISTGQRNITTSGSKSNWPRSVSLLNPDNHQ